MSKAEPSFVDIECMGELQQEDGEMVWGQKKLSAGAVELKDLTGSECSGVDADVVEGAGQE